MQHLQYVGNTLYFEQIPLEESGKEFGTPLYVYSESALTIHFQQIDKAFRKHPHLICYALKANSNPTIIRKLAALGVGADVVSIGELQLALQAGILPEKIVFAGVGKRDDEILAALDAGIKGFNVESEMELKVIDALAGRMGKMAPVSLRVNPNMDIHGHPYITTGRHHDKCGLSIDTVVKLSKNFAQFSNCELIGLHAHLGSQISEIAPYAVLGRKMRNLANDVRSHGHALQYLDIGGGLGVDYM
ncbi:MAG: diaminopimelate decarboxylase family protein, partial [bacterium]